MTNLEWATWILAILTGVLALSTIAYTWVTYKLYQGSNHQTDAIRELTESILQIPIIENSIQTKRELQEKLNTELNKQKTAQQNAVTGR